jgi:hypothetical protein
MQACSCRLLLACSYRDRDGDALRCVVPTSAPKQSRTRPREFPNVVAGAEQRRIGGA